MIKKERCRHERNSWIILGGLAEWCYACGAWRALGIVRGNELERMPGDAGKWHRPSGDKNINPYKEIIL